MSQQLISIIVPVYNEAPNLSPLFKEVSAYTKQLPYHFEYVFVDDGSTDDSARTLHNLAKDQKRVHIIQLARNFGKEAAMAAGLHAAKGDAAIIMDADLQMPPRLLGKFIQKWQSGAEVVVGIFAARNMSPFRRLGASWFYGIMQRIAHTKITPHATDYRLLDREVIDTYNGLTERNRVTRGLIDWLGFKRDYIYFQQRPRKHGKPNYSLSKLVTLAINSFTNYSLLPLKLAGYLGLVILLVSAPGGVFLYIERYILHDPFNWGITGTTMLAAMTLFLVGVVLACLGLISLYIAHIHAEVINRPLYVARKTARPEPAQADGLSPEHTLANVAKEKAEATQEMPEVAQA